MSNIYTHIQQIVYHSLKIEKALYTKYSQQKVKKFEDFFSTKPVKWVIDFKDNLHVKENEEYLKKYYPITIQSNKFKQLLEYYKYHKDIPRMFFGFLADMATYFYEKKKKYEYRKIKIQLGIPYEQSKYEKLNEDIQVLNSITKLSEKSAKSLLRQIIKFQKEDDYINIDETWLTMQQQIQTEKNNQKQLSKQPTQNLKLLKQLVIRNNQLNKDKLKLNLPFNLITGKVQANIRNSQKQSPERPIPTQKSSSQQHINSSQEENEFQKFMKAKIIKLSQDNKIKIQKIFSNKVDQNNCNSNQAKHSSAHFITSTRSVSSEQLKTEQMRLSQIISSGGNNQSQPKLFNYITPVHKKSNSQQSLQTEFTPAKKESKLIKIYSNNFSSKIKTQPKKTPEKLRQFYKASAQTSQNSSQKNLLKNLDKLSSFQQFKIMLESPHPKQKKKLQLHNTDTIRLQTEYKQNTKRQSITLTHNKVNGKIIIKKQ
ncbi:unnamed protein product (macronuclear) [Paramecium tetraurelia]|uniref:PiggyBac transposable element-derived protein domain-containing protein n=1 Tax=Paramecium tetraurelia TaxID=5888 RepID=A0D153_PARTE|nr:uncharacterized protein GSPATT00012294001 [Paramecium tetraurelia]CAK76770.1 unnamed protein product [Paramecium tetraurelia]|eukprot:XP_001444167.1 hypothetical protein (macronuclear) [Paramecium tetraurelia strain d4-2]